jgi:hypothetical protein
MSYAAKRTERRRLLILKLMIEDGGRTNDGTLLTALRAIGESQEMSRDVCRQLLRDLADRDCVTLDMERDTIMVARIGERGRMAAAGDIDVGGVASPFEGL